MDSRELFERLTQHKGGVPEPLNETTVIYIAGPYNSKTEWGLELNIRHAEDAALRLWLAGWAVICPHKNTAHFGGQLHNSLDDRNMWLNGDLELVRRCDAMYVLTGWEDSNGTKAEIALAERLGMEVIYEDD